MTERQPFVVGFRRNGTVRYWHGLPGSAHSPTVSRQEASRPVGFLPEGRPAARDVPCVSRRRAEGVEAPLGPPGAVYSPLRDPVGQPAGPLRVEAQARR